MVIRAMVWYMQYKLEEARSEALRAADLFEELGAAKEYRKLLQLMQGPRDGTSD